MRHCPYDQESGRNLNLLGARNEERETLLTKNSVIARGAMARISLTDKSDRYGIPLHYESVR